MMFLLALPTWIKVAVAGLAVVGVLQLQHWWVVKGLRSDIAELKLMLDQERLATADLRLAVRDVQANRDKLETTIKDQNAAIDILQARARQVEASANLRVARAVRAGEEVARELRAETTRVPPGHAEMNTWLQGRLGV